MINKKILIVSNNALSETNNNGRTMMKLLSPEDKEKIAQFYIRATVPSFDICDKYFFVSDIDLIKSVIKRRSAGRVMTRDDFVVSEERRTDPINRIPRTAWMMLARNFLWKRKIWRKKFEAWVEDFGPECVILQAGDSPFMYDISVGIAKKHQIPLVIFNTEDYFFKKHNYFKKKLKSDFFYNIYKCVLSRSVRKAMNVAEISIYLHEQLEALYQKEFGKKSTYIYTTTDVPYMGDEGDKPIFSYAGNFGYKRYEVLTKVAKALHKIDPTYYLDVYGDLRRLPEQEAIYGCPEIRFHGKISYEQVKKVMSESMLLFHVENGEEYFRKEVENGMSTKLADTLACGRCLVVVAPESVFCAKYIQKNKCGCVITDEEMLETSLREIINNKEKRAQYIEAGQKVVAQNHCADKNRAKMESIINELSGPSGVI